MIYFHRSPIEAVSRQLRDNAKAAMKLMDRFPVCEAEDINQAKEKNHESINPATERHNLDWRTLFFIHLQS